MSRFMELTTGVEAPAQLVSRLRERTGGNPFYLTEVVRLLTTQNRSEGPHKPLGLSEDDSPHPIEDWLDELVPESVVEAVLRRLEQLSQDARDILLPASVLGRDFDLEPLGELVGRPIDQFLELVEEATAFGFVAERHGSPDGYRFAHVLVRDALYSRLSAARRARLHQRIGEVLESIHADDLETHLAELAHHFLQAPTQTGTAKAVKYLRQAGRRAMTMLAYEEAARLFALALQQPLDQTIRCDLLLALGEAQAKAGDTPGARSAYKQAADLALTLGSVEPFARAALGFGDAYEIGIINQPLIDLLQQALQMLDEQDSALRARLLGRFAVALYWMDPREQSGPIERRAVLSETAVQMARRLGDKRLLASVLHARFYALWGPDHLDERLALADEIIELANASVDHEMALQGHMWRMFSHLEAGDIRIVDEEIDVYRQIAEDLRQPIYLFWASLWQGMRAHMRGEFDDAERLCSQALAIGQRAQDPTMLNQGCVSQLVCIRKDQGRMPEFVGTLGQFADQFESMPAWRAGAALVKAMLGHTAAAQQELDRIASNDFEVVRRDAGWYATMNMLAELSILLRDANRAAAVYQLLLPYQQRCLVYGYATVCTGSAARFLGQLATMAGDWTAATGHFQIALETNERIGARPALAFTRYEYARALSLRGLANDRDAARDLLNEALLEARELGMTPLAEMAAEQYVSESLRTGSA